jgi:DNA mismatch repair protein MutL
MTSEPTSRRIHVLRDSDARKIAAGEVIDRPLSVVRELLDNAIDAGATEITVHIEGGGIRRIRVTDNGVGMVSEDLEICILPHATSKIEKTEDIYTVGTLGFRGEALSSIATCSKLEIISYTGDPTTKGSRLVVHAGKVVDNGDASTSAGTIVDVGDLFYSLPGRRKFLKRISSETQRCRQAFLEKALPFPEIAFRLFVDGDLKLFLPPQSMLERVTAIYENTISPSYWDHIKDESDGVTLEAVLTSPDYSRRDRRFLQVYVNHRRIQEYALLQAISYGYSEHLPGGSYPAVCLSINLDPALVDFNIHPAKREVRFRNLSVVHHAVVTLIRSHLAGYKIHVEDALTDRQTSLVGETGPEYTASSHLPRQGFMGGAEPRKGIDLSRAREHLTTVDEPDVVANTEPMPMYHGQVFGLFLLAELDGKLYIVDQHAAHERIIYEELISRDPVIQNLLVPIHIELEEDEEAVLEKNLPTYAGLGIALEKQEPCSWILVACPAVCLDIKDDLAELIKGWRGDSSALEQELYATISCRSAVMDGEVLDDLSASELVKKALALRNARCPHGRPIWVELSREKLFELVERTF